MRAFGYLRVSKERAGQVSPDAQRSEIEAHCEREGWTIVEWFSDIDFSATQYRPLEMPGFSEMVRRAEDGEADVVVCYRVDRTVREHTGDWYLVRASLEASGVKMAFAGRDYDDSPEGDFSLGLDVLLARLESRRLGVRLRSMHRQLARQGKFSAGLPPFGWRRVHDQDGQQRLVLEPTEAEWRRRIHEWYHQGASAEAITKRLNASGVLTRRGRMWVPGHIPKFLSTPTQIGATVVDGEYVITGRIEPLLTQEEYQQTLAIMAVRSRRFGRTGRTSSRYPLGSAMVRCGTCGGPLYIHDDASGVRYRCERRRNAVCDNGVCVKADILMREVESRLFYVLKHPRARKKVHKRTEDITALVAEESRLVASLGRLAALFSEGQIEREEFRHAQQTQRDKLDRVRARIERASIQIESEAMKPSDAELASVYVITPDTWPDLSVETKRRICATMIETVTVNPRGNGRRRIEISWR